MVNTYIEVILMKRRFGVLLALVLGCLLGFFGVFVSVFADSTLNEQYAIILIILLVYGILNGVWGYLMPSISWIWGIIFGAPGVILLFIYYRTQPNPLYPIYMALILAVSCICGRAGSKIKTKRRMKSTFY